MHFVSIITFSEKKIKNEKVVQNLWFLVSTTKEMIDWYFKFNYQSI